MGTSRGLRVNVGVVVDAQAFANGRVFGVALTHNRPAFTREPVRRHDLQVFYARRHVATIFWALGGDVRLVCCCFEHRLDVAKEPRPQKYRVIIVNHMRQQSPRFSVVIPTKDRAEYLLHTLRTCSLQKYDNVTFLVSDDGSSDSTRDVVNSAARLDDRIRYITPGRSVGMLENFEFALSHVDPGFVIALGGDDGFLPNGLHDLSKLLLSTGAELVTWASPVFTYPNPIQVRGLLNLHTIWARPLTGIRIVKSREYLRRQATDLAYSSDVETPMFYVKGVASTRLIEKVKSRTKDGRFYSCATPDGFSGIALAGEVEEFVFSGTPFSLYGVSPTSQGANYMASGEAALKQSEEFFRNAETRPMHADLASLPYSPLISLMTADYLLTCRDLVGADVYPNIDYRRVIERAIEELSDGLFSKERIARELEILSNLARYHGLERDFNRIVGAARRNDKKPLRDTAIGPRNLMLSGNETGAENIFDAAFFCYFFYHFGARFSVQLAAKMFCNSITHKMRSYSFLKKHFSRRDPLIED